MIVVRVEHDGRRMRLQMRIRTVPMHSDTILMLTDFDTTLLKLRRKNMEAVTLFVPEVAGAYKRCHTHATRREDGEIHQLIGDLVTIDGDIALPAHGIDHAGKQTITLL